MVQGTTSDAGKSILVTGLCRLLARRGIRVAPFKPQNMSLNSAVTPEQGEIGRAQALQAIAAGVAPHTDMNPVLLKPSSDQVAQVILNGKPAHDMNAMDYHQYKTRAMATVMAAWQRLGERFEAVMIEGAGSPAEINLRDRDIANMGFAEAADVPVIIVADIDRGGVFAHLTGTLDLLSPGEQEHGREDGAISDNGLVAGTYLHGLFDRPESCAALLQWAGLSDAIGLDRDAIREAELERLADCLEQHLALDTLFPQWFQAA